MEDLTLTGRIPCSRAGGRQWGKYMDGIKRAGEAGTDTASDKRGTGVAIHGHQRL